MSIFINKFGEFRSGWAVALTSATYILIGFAPPYILMAIGESDLNSQNAQLAMAVYFCAVVGYAIGLWKLMYRKTSLQAIGLFRARSWINLGIGLAIGITLISAVFFILLALGQITVTEIDWSIATSGAWATGFVMVFPQAASEEFVFRGVMMGALKFSRNKFLIAFVPALIFGLMHALNPGASILSTVNIAIAGLMFSVLFIRTGNLVLVTGVHFAWNAFQSYVYGSPVSGLEIGDSIVKIQMGPNTLLNGGAFGFELGLITPIVCLICTALIWFLYHPNYSNDSTWNWEA